MQRLLEHFRHHEKTVSIHIGPSNPIDIPEHVYQMHLWQNVEENIRLATEAGIKPLSIDDIIRQFSIDTLSRQAVLFDTPPVPGFAGNHWRLIGVEQPTVHLQMCGIFGNYIQEGIPVLTFRRDAVLFTGLSIQRYSIENKSQSLEHVLYRREQEKLKGKATMPSDITYEGETIYFADVKGKLTPIDQHPLFYPKK
jgi:hypothetical protein